MIHRNIKFDLPDLFMTKRWDLVAESVAADTVQHYLLRVVGFQKTRKSLMALVASSFRIPLYFRFKGQLSSGVHHKVELDRDNRISLVAYGYSMKDSVEERELALKTAISKHGVAAVVERLEFLSQAWSGTPMFLDVICHDLNFSKSLQ